MNAYRQLRVSCAMFVVWLAISTVAQSADNYMLGTTWSVPEHWSLNAPPANGDNAFITGSSPGDLTVLFDYNYTSPGLGGFTVDNTGGRKTVLSIATNSLIAATAYAGKTGQGTVRQTGGVMSLAFDLTLGDAAGSSGRYELIDGQLTAERSLAVGGSGSGTFVQTGGSVASHKVKVADNWGSSGRYELSGGTLGVSELELARGGQRTGVLAIGGSGRLEVDTVFYMMGGQSTVEQTGGTAICSNAILGEEGDANGVGTWNLSGGTATVGSFLDVHNGTYNVSGTGHLTAARLGLYGGFDGPDATAGYCSQSGGQVHVTDSLTIGATAEAAKTPRYTLSDGTLTAGTVAVGGEGAGLFTQTGGIASITDLNVLAHGRYEYGGGSLTIINTWALAGQFDFLNSTATMTAGPGAAVNLSGGQVLHATQATLNVRGTDSLVIFAGGFNPDTQFKSFSNEGTTHFAGSTLTVAEGKTVKLVGDFHDHVVVAGTLTNKGQPVNLTHGAEVSGTGLVDLGDGTLTVQDAISGISGGRLTARYGCVGQTGQGTFRQTGGVMSLAFDLTLGDAAGSSGRYELIDGQLTAERSLAVGGSGSGTFVQTGGSVASHKVKVADNWGSSGRYELSGGALGVSELELARGGQRTGVLAIGGSGRLEVDTVFYMMGGQSTVEQTGGTAICSNAILGEEGDANGVGTWNLSGGTATVGSFLDVHNGTYNVSGTGHLTAARLGLYGGFDGPDATAGYCSQSGGQVHVTDSLTIGATAEAAKTPRYTLSDGTLTAGTVAVGGEGAGLFTQTGGVATITNLVVDANGRCEVSGGSLSATKFTNGGQFTFSGGGITASTFFINTGTVTLSGTGTRAIAGSVTNAFLLRKVFGRAPHAWACIKRTHPYPDGKIVYPNAKENKDASKEGSGAVLCLERRRIAQGRT